MRFEQEQRLKISIIVPVYNVAQYLDDCVRSLVEQTYMNIEIILIDDGSTDLSAAICDKWGERDKRIHVEHTDNLGVSHARNIGIKIATGDYIGFVDADDWVEKDTYECLLDEMISKNVEVVGGGYTREEPSGGIVTLRKESANVYSREEILKEIFSLKNKKIIWWELWDKLFRADLVKRNRFDESIATSEDKLFFWQVMEKVAKFAYMPLFKYHYRTRDGSATHSVINNKTLTELEANRRILQLSKKENRILQRLALANYVRSIVSCTKKMLVCNPNNYKQLIMKNQDEIRENFLKYNCALGISVYSIRALGYLSLPFFICIKLIFIIRSR